MNFNPFCCIQIPVQKALKITALFQIGVGAFSIVLITIILIAYAAADKVIENKKAEVHDIDLKNSFYEGIVPILCLSFYGIGMGTLLLIGSAQRNHRKCLIWLIGIAVETIVYVILASIMLAHISRGEATFENVEGYFFQIVINVYLMLIVFKFLSELTSDPTAAGYV